VKRPVLAAALAAAFSVASAASAGNAANAANAAAPSLLAPLAGDGAQPAAPWRFAGLPKQTIPATGFALVDIDGQRVLRVRSDRSYGNLVHPVEGTAAGRWLSWRWRVDEPVAGADLRRKSGDDTAVKVCAMYDLPLDVLPFWERQKMRLARSLSGEPLPAATLCYVWDPALPSGTVLPNVYSPRLRWMVLRGAGTPLASWQAERRDLSADFLRAFGDESPKVPPLTAIVVGADTDTPGSQALAYVADLALTP
jgi:hypothetical protein